jgi:very-short-patch-repair endonuclease
MATRILQSRDWNTTGFEIDSCELGFRILRIPGYEVIREDGNVIQKIREFVRVAIEAQNPSPRPLSPTKRGEGRKN